MFNFRFPSPATTTVAATTSGSTMTFAPLTISQPPNPFGTASPSQLFRFGGGAQNTPTISPFGNPSIPATSTNNTLPNYNPSIFGTNSTASTTPTTNVFGTNFTGTTVKFNPVSAQAPFSTASTSSNVFGNNNPITTPAIPWGPIVGNTNQTSATPTNPLINGSGTIPTTNIFGPSPWNMTSPFKTATSTAPAATSVFPPPTITNPSPFNPPTNINASPMSVANSQPVSSTNIFSQTMIATPVNSTASTNTTNRWNIPNTSTITGPSIFPGFNPNTSTATPSNIFNFPITSTAAPIVNNLTTQTTVPPATSFSFLFPATSILNTSPSTTTTTTATTSIFNPSPITSQSTTQTQPTVTSSSSTESQNTQSSTSFIYQNFLAASLLDPYGNRGRKDFTNINQNPISADPTAVTTLSTTSIASTPIPIILPINSNSRKTSSARSVVDVNFKLKPASSLPTLNDDADDDIKPITQSPIVSTGSKKSTLAGNFTDEEESILLSRNKMSKLRLSNDVVNPSDSSRSLYPVRRLAELEKLNNITPPASLSSSPTSTVMNERTSRQSNENRDLSSNHRTSSSVSPQRLSSPIIQSKLNNQPQTYRLPILTRNNYYMKPTLSELKSLFNDKSQCILKQFTVGHENYGSVTFYGQIDVAGLNLDEIIEINRHEVVVYPDDDNKPSVGKGLNVPARITLLGVYPIDRTTREEITDIDRIKAINYNDYLCEVTKNFDGEFINYNVTDGAWTFMVKHFTRYGLDDNQVDFVVE